MRKAAEILRTDRPRPATDGEMHADSALNEDFRKRVFPHSTLKEKPTFSSSPISTQRTLR